MMLVHICCSVDSHYFLQELDRLYPEERLVGFFYNPNIHPYEEYRLRLDDVRRSCDSLGIELLEDGYDESEWIREKLHLESHPEGGVRCKECFTERLETTARKALELGVDEFTTTLMMSPKKSFEVLKSEGESVASRFALRFFAIDLRKDGGTQRQFALAKEDGLYKQNYCGCLFALKKQRESMGKEPIETYSPITKQTLPNSFEEKRVLYENRTPDKIYTKRNFLNYRLLRGYIADERGVIDSHILYFSTQKQKLSKSKIERLSEHLGFLPKSNSYIMDIALLSKLSNKKFSSLQELREHPLSIKEEIDIRERLVGCFSTSAIFVVKRLDFSSKCHTYIDSVTFDDISENLTMI